MRAYIFFFSLCAFMFAAIADEMPDYYKFKTKYEKDFWYWHAYPYAFDKSQHPDSIVIIDNGLSGTTYPREDNYAYTFLRVLLNTDIKDDFWSRELNVGLREGLGLLSHLIGKEGKGPVMHISRASLAFLDPDWTGTVTKKNNYLRFLPEYYIYAAIIACKDRGIQTLDEEAHVQAAMKTVSYYRRNRSAMDDNPVMDSLIALPDSKVEEIIRRLYKSCGTKDLTIKVQPDKRMRSVGSAEVWGKMQGDTIKMPRKHQAKNDSDNYIIVMHGAPVLKIKLPMTEDVEYIAARALFDDLIKDAPSYNGGTNMYLDQYLDAFAQTKNIEFSLSSLAFLNPEWCRANVKNNPYCRRLVDVYVLAYEIYCKDHNLQKSDEESHVKAAMMTIDYYRRNREYMDDNPVLDSMLTLPDEDIEKIVRNLYHICSTKDAVM